MPCGVIQHDSTLGLPHLPLIHTLFIYGMLSHVHLPFASRQCQFAVSWRFLALSENRLPQNSHGFIIMFPIFSPYFTICSHYPTIFSYISLCFPMFSNKQWPFHRGDLLPQPQLKRPRSCCAAWPSAWRSSASRSSCRMPLRCSRRENHGKTMGKSVILRKTDGKPWFILG